MEYQFINIQIDSCPLPLKNLGTIKDNSYSEVHEFMTAAPAEYFLTHFIGDYKNKNTQRPAVHSVI